MGVVSSFSQILSLLSSHLPRPPPICATACRRRVRLALRATISGVRWSSRFSLSQTSESIQHERFHDPCASRSPRVCTWSPYIYWYGEAETYKDSLSSSVTYANMLSWDIAHSTGTLEHAHRRVGSTQSPAFAGVDVQGPVFGASRPSCRMSISAA